jgi:hypothetical protein
VNKSSVLTSERHKPRTLGRGKPRASSIPTVGRLPSCGPKASPLKGGVKVALDFSFSTASRWFLRDGFGGFLSQPPHFSGGQRRGLTFALPAHRSFGQGHYKSLA